MISLNALLGRPVEYYEYPWAIEGRLRSAIAAPLAVSGERRRLHLLEVDAAERASLPHRMPHPLFRAGAAFMQLLPAGMLPPHSLRPPARGRQGQPLFHAEGPPFRLPRFSEAQRQISDPVPSADPTPAIELRSRGCAWDGRQHKEDFASFAERETAYFIKIDPNWVAEPRPERARGRLRPSDRRAADASPRWRASSKEMQAFHQAALARAFCRRRSGPTAAPGSVRDPTIRRSRCGAVCAARAQASGRNAARTASGFISFGRQ